MATRSYSSFLLRLWQVNDAENEASQTSPSIILHLQNLQTGLTYQLNSLQELNKILYQTFDKPEDYNLPSEVQVDLEVEIEEIKTLLGPLVSDSKDSQDR